MDRELARSACPQAVAESTSSRDEPRTGWKLWGREWARVLHANAHDEAAALAWLDRAIESAASNLEFSIALGVPGVSGTFALKVEAHAARSRAFADAALAERCGSVSVWAGGSLCRAAASLGVEVPALVLPEHVASYGSSVRRHKWKAGDALWARAAAVAGRRRSRDGVREWMHRVVLKALRAEEARAGVEPGAVLELAFMLPLALREVCAGAARAAGAPSLSAWAAPVLEREVEVRQGL